MLKVHFNGAGGEGKGNCMGGGEGGREGGWGWGGEGQALSCASALSPPPSLEMREAENLESDNVHVKRIILLQSGKDFVSCKVACLKIFFPPKLFQD